MADTTHKYLCAYCKQYIFSPSPLALAAAVNTHNTCLHPMDFANWTATGIVLSACYSGAPGPLPQYLVPYKASSEWGDAHPPVLTEYDRLLLEVAAIKWEK